MEYLTEKLGRERKGRIKKLLGGGEKDERDLTYFYYIN